MVRDYLEKSYAPAARHGDELAANAYTRTRELAAWKAKIRACWDDVEVLDVEGDVMAADVGDQRSVRAVVRHGRLTVEDVVVQLAHGPVGPNGEVVEPLVAELRAIETTDGTTIFEGAFTAVTAGLYGYAVRVLPYHRDLITPMDMGLIAWA
jgi:starch phosphorylase